MCYSGQCYLSSVIGRRSGNRGQCAQPCRLPYGYGRFESTRYPLSLKDNCLVGDTGRASAAWASRLAQDRRPHEAAASTSPSSTRAYRTVVERQAASRRAICKSLKPPSPGRASPQGIFPRPDRRGHVRPPAGGEETGHPSSPPPARPMSRARRQRIGVKFYAILQSGRPAQLAVEDADGQRLQDQLAPCRSQRFTRSLTQQDLEAAAPKDWRHAVRLYAACATVLGPGLMLPALGHQRHAPRRRSQSLTARRGRVAHAADRTPTIEPRALRRHRPASRS
ncbi:MAG: U32 family peptidase [Acutalibacteraceae bacterium]